MARVARTGADRARGTPPTAITAGAAFEVVFARTRALGAFALMPRAAAYAFALCVALPAVALIAALTPMSLGLHRTGPWVFFVGVIAAPVVEEIVFRLGVHDALAHASAARFGALSLANLGTAFVFAAAHLLRHSPGWALAVAGPALVYGYFYERYHRLVAPIGLHAVYNAAFSCLLVPG